MFLIPISGYTLSSYSHYGDSFSFLKLFDITYIFAKNETLAKLWYSIHQIIAFSALGLIGLHILAAINHTVYAKNFNFIKRII